MLDNVSRRENNQFLGYFNGRKHVAKKLGISSCFFEDVSIEKVYNKSNYTSLFLYLPQFLKRWALELGGTKIRG